MRYLIIYILAIGTAGLSGCGKKELPPPPSTHAILVKNLFINLAKGQHEVAVSRIQKLRALSPNNEFLIQMEERELCSHYIKEAQKQLDAGNINEAVATINTIHQKYPLNRNLLAIINELAILQNLHNRIKLLNSASTSNEMNAQIDAIAALLRKYPEAKILEPLMRKKVLQAFKLKLYEEKRARFDLLCDIKSAQESPQKEPELHDILSAVLNVANSAVVKKSDRIAPDLLD